MSASKVIRWAGLSAVIAGVLIVVTQLIHPADDPSSVATSSWAIAHSLILGSSIFGLLGIAGLYARQVEESGWLGLIGFLMLIVAEALITGFAVVEAFIFPVLATEAPQYIVDFFAFENLGAFGAVLLVTILLFVIGGLLFGIAVIRAGILPRWAAILFIIGSVSSLVVPALPEAAGKIIGVVLGLGLAWLGYALWSERREKSSEPIPAMQR
jgi:hypothetical protein